MELRAFLHLHRQGPLLIKSWVALEIFDHIIEENRTSSLTADFARDSCVTEVDVRVPISRRIVEKSSDKCFRHSELLFDFRKRLFSELFQHWKVIAGQVADAPQTPVLHDRKAVELILRIRTLPIKVQKPGVSLSDAQLDLLLLVNNVIHPLVHRRLDRVNDWLDDFEVVLVSLTEQEATLSAVLLDVCLCRRIDELAQALILI